MRRQRPVINCDAWHSRHVSARREFSYSGIGDGVRRARPGRYAAGLHARRPLADEMVLVNLVLFYRSDILEVVKSCLAN